MATGPEYVAHSPWPSAYSTVSMPLPCPSSPAIATVSGTSRCQPAALGGALTVAVAVGAVVSASVTSVRNRPDITVLLPLVLRTWTVTGSSTVQPTHWPSTKFVTATDG